jgi:hypothetical protein
MANRIRPSDIPRWLNGKQMFTNAGDRYPQKIYDNDVPGDEWAVTRSFSRQMRTCSSNLRAKAQLFKQRRKKSKADSKRGKR